MCGEKTDRAETLRGWGLGWYAADIDKAREAERQAGLDKMAALITRLGENGG